MSMGKRPSESRSDLPLLFTSHWLTKSYGYAESDSMPRRKQLVNNNNDHRILSFRKELECHIHCKIFTSGKTLEIL